MREVTIEQHLCDKVKSIGGMCLKLVPTINNGIPDRMVLYTNKVYFIELKASNGVLRPLQQHMIDKLLRMGQSVEVINSIAQVDSFIKRIQE